MSNSQKHGDRFWLSTEGYYFEYRPDNNDRNITRATLYDEKTGKRVDDVRVSEGHGNAHRNHHQVINYFEARITMGLIPKPTQ